MGEKYSIGRAKSYKDLWAEVVLCLSRLERCDPCSLPVKPAMARILRREVRYVILELTANINGTERVLLLKDQKEEMGRDRCGVYEPLMLHMFPDEKPSDALIRLVVKLLNFPEKQCKKHFSFEYAAVKKFQESICFPGLMTLYRVKKIRVHLQDLHHPDLRCLGLPHGDDFETNVKWVVHTHTNVLTWASHEKFERESFLGNDPEFEMDTSDEDECSVTDGSCGLHMQNCAQEYSSEQRAFGDVCRNMLAVSNSPQLSNEGL